MQKQTLIFFVLIFTLLAIGCKKPVKKFTTTRIDPKSHNFSYLDKKLKDVKILALGESSHGFGSVHSYKAEMIKYLHKNLGYNLMVFESGYGDVGLSMLNIDKGDTLQLMGGMLPPNLRSEQILPLIKYVKENIESDLPLEVKGMDTKWSGKAFKFKLMYVIKRLEPKIIQDSVSQGFVAYDMAFHSLDEEERWTNYMGLYNDAFALAQSILVENKEDIKELQLADDTEYNLLIKSVEMMLKIGDYQFGEAYTRGLSLRDSIMAANVISFVEESPKAKVILWGHNGHIEKGPGEGDNIKWMGHYLKEKFGEDYYSMGIYAKKGLIYQSEERKTSNFDIADQSFIEGKIDANYGKDAYLDLPLYDETNTSWINNLINGYELEAGGQVRFVPTKRFDGVILIGETEAPNFMIDKQTRRGQ